MRLGRLFCLLLVGWLGSPFTSLIDVAFAFAVVGMEATPTLLTSTTSSPVPPHHHHHNHHHHHHNDSNTSNNDSTPNTITTAQPVAFGCALANSPAGSLAPGGVFHSLPTSPFHYHQQQQFQQQPQQQQEHGFRRKWSQSWMNELESSSSRMGVASLPSSPSRPTTSTNNPRKRTLMMEDEEEDQDQDQEESGSGHHSTTTTSASNSTSTDFWRRKNKRPIIGLQWNSSTTATTSAFPSPLSAALDLHAIQSELVQKEQRMLDAFPYNKYGNGRDNYSFHRIRTHLVDLKVERGLGVVFTKHRSFPFSRRTMSITS